MGTRNRTKIALLLMMVGGAPRAEAGLPALFRAPLDCLGAMWGRLRRAPASAEPIRTRALYHPEDEVLQAFSVKNLLPKDQSLLRHLEAQRQEQLACRARHDTSAEEDIVREEAQKISELSLQTRLRLFFAAAMDFNREGGRLKFENMDESTYYRMAEMVNEASRGTYKFLPASVPAQRQYMIEHLVMSYFEAVMIDTDNVAMFRREILKFYPEAARLSPEEVAAEAPHQGDRQLLNYFLFRYEG